MKWLLLITICSGINNCFSQIGLTAFTKQSLPASIIYKGNLEKAVGWKDNSGNHVVVLSISDEVGGKAFTDEGTNKSLYAYHYVIKKDTVKQLWKLYDFVQECDVDLFLYFVKKTFAVTDLNKDGNAEVWIVYKVSCQGDVSPVPMKVIMYEEEKKYAMRGSTRVQESKNKFIGGNYTFDANFDKAPDVFKEYARKLWNRHKIEDWKQ